VLAKSRQRHPLAKWKTMGSATGVLAGMDA